MITPAILEKDLTSIKEKITISKTAGCSFVQIDICDGIFGQQKTYPFTLNKDIKNGMFNFDVDYSLDLMIKDIETYIELVIHSKAKQLIIHANSTKHLKDVFLKLQGINKEIVLAVLPDEKVESLKWVEEYIDGIQCMGIQHIGAQGEVFCDDVYETIKKVKSVFPDKFIMIDGGVNDTNIVKLKECGVSRFNIGSFFFNSKNVKKTLEELSQKTLN